MHSSEADPILSSFFDIVFLHCFFTLFFLFFDTICLTMLLTLFFALFFTLFFDTVFLHCFLTLFLALFLKLHLSWLCSNGWRISSSILTGLFSLPHFQPKKSFIPTEQATISWWMCNEFMLGMGMLVRTYEILYLKVAVSRDFYHFLFHLSNPSGPLISIKNSFSRRYSQNKLLRAG